MTSLSGGSEVLKVDRRGYVLVGKDRRKELMEEFGRSGLSAAAFARMAGVKYQTFMGWLARSRRETKAPGDIALSCKSPVRLFEAEVSGVSNTSQAGLVIELVGGNRIRVETPVQVAMAAELLNLMARSRC